MPMPMAVLWPDAVIYMSFLVEISLDRLCEKEAQSGDGWMDGWVGTYIKLMCLTPPCLQDSNLIFPSA